MSFPLYVNDEDDSDYVPFSGRDDEEDDEAELEIEADEDDDDEDLADIFENAGNSPQPEASPEPRAPRVTRTSLGSLQRTLCCTSSMKPARGYHTRRLFGPDHCLTGGSAICLI